MDKILRVLHVEDSERDAELLDRHIRKAGYELETARVDNAVDLRSILAEQWDIVLCDYSMPNFNALGALALVKEFAVDVPIIIISGTVGEEVAVQIMRAGAQDYLMKDKLVRLVPAIQRELEEAENRRERKKAELKLKASEERFRAIYETEPECVKLLGKYGDLLEMNPAGLAMIEAESLDQVRGTLMIDLILPEYRPAFAELGKSVFRGESGRLEFEITSLKGTRRWLDTSATALRNELGEVEALLGITRDITEKKLAEEKFRENEALLSSTQRIAHIGSWVMHLSDTETGESPRESWSDEHYRIFGFEPGEVETTEEVFYNSVHPDDREGLASTIRESIDKKKPFDIEHRIILPDGRERIVHALGELVLDQKTGNPVKLLGSVQDITERRRVEDALRESEKAERTAAAIHSSILNALPAHIALLDEHGVVLSVNEAWRRFAVANVMDESDFGVGQNYLEVCANARGDCAEEAQNVAHGIRRILTGEANEFTLEYACDTPTEKLWYRLMVTPVHESRLAGAVVMHLNITERKLAEAARRESEERLGLLFEQMKDGFYISTPDGRLLDINPAIVEMFGYSSREEMLKVDVARDLYFSVEDRKGRSFVDGKEESEVYRMRRKDGSSIWVEDRGQYKYDKDGSIEFHQGLLRDVTERRLAEASLIRSAERYRDLVENAYDMIYTRDLDGNFTSINSAGVKLIGYSQQEFLQMNMRQIMGPDDWDRVQGLITRKIAGKEESSYEMDILAKDGRWIRLEVNTTLIYRAGAAVGVQGIARDITERKRIENQLIESESHKGAILESALDCIVAMNSDGMVTEFNPAAEKVFGYSRADAIGEPLAELLIPPALRDQHQRGLDHYFATGEGPLMGKRIEISAMRSDGSEFPVELSINAVELHGSTVFTAYIRDISDRKIAEASLFQSELRYRDLVQNANDIIYSLDLEGNFMSLNNAGERIVGYTLEEVVRMNFSDIVATDLLEYAKQLMQEKLSGVDGTSYEIDIIAKDGRRISLEVTSKLAVQDGMPVGIQGIARDVTERKVALDQLEQSSALLRMAGQAARLGGWRLELPERTLSWSDESCSIHDVLPGYIPTIDEGIASYYPENRAEVMAYVNNCAENGTPYDFELPKVTAKGRHIWVRSIGEAVRDADGKIIRLQGAIQDITDRKKAEDSLRQTNTLMRIAGELTLTGGWTIKVPENQIFWSDELSDILEFPRRTNLDLSNVLDLFPQPGRDEVIAGITACSNDGTPLDIEVEIVTGKGRRIWAHLVAEADRRVDGMIDGIHGAFQDISDRKGAEEQLRQSQKLESVGLLAGGIAHDFNNMLTAINGYSDLTLRQMKADDPLRRNIEEVKKAGERSAALTNQLLAFSRRQILQPEVVYLNRIITETSTLLERMIGEDIELVTVLSPNAGKVKADPSQLTQIIMNLAVNARDAMPKGGKLTFETNNIVLDQEYTNHHTYVLPGSYVKLTVSDNGAGMDPETQQRIFEPFFTTKATGEGTGLGLSMVYGIIKQSNGHIMLYSEPGVGTTFTIYLPRVIDISEEVEAAELFDELPSGTETILLVEDEENVRMLTRQILEMCGYTVLEATNGKGALDICEKNPGTIHLLMTDVVMPEMGGRELSEKVSLNWPKMPVLFTSGYTDDAVVRHGVIAETANFIHKPFNMEDLTNKIRSILDESKAS